MPCSYYLAALPVLVRARVSARGWVRAYEGWRAQGLCGMVIRRGGGGGGGQVEGDELVRTIDLSSFADVEQLQEVG